MIGAIIARRMTRKAFVALERGDLTAYMKTVAPEAIFEFPGRTTISGRFEGAEAIRAWMQEWFDAMPTRRFSLHKVAVDRIITMGTDNALLVEWTLTQTDRHDRTHVLDGVTSLTIQKGRATLIRDYSSDQALEEVWDVRTDASSAS